jgi:cysteine desulfuration protein SufE
MSIVQQQDKIISEMAGLVDWLEKYQYLIQQGKELRPSDELAQSEENSIPGCQSKVWIIIKLTEGKAQILADSDSLVTKGLLVLLVRILNNQKPQDISNADLYFLAQTGLSTNLSPTRSNGLVSIVKHIKQSVAELVE